ncbi:MAG: TIGR02391 family protein [Pseudohongiellaceae bacterium]
MTTSNPFELKFDPKTIKHLGLKMYGTLPPALSELISNSYDADASEVKVIFHEQKGKPEYIEVIDNGEGMTVEDIQEKFLVIGRNRRELDGDKPSKKYNRLPTGKKGLGKLALFGLAKKIRITTRKEGKESIFELDWDVLTNSDGTYHPKDIAVNKPTEKSDGTVVKLSELKRKSRFTIEMFANSISRIFIVDENFHITLESTSGKSYDVSNERKYGQIKEQFKWDIKSLIPEDSEYRDKELSGEIYTSEKPIPASSDLRGITLFSRGKLVNKPDYYSKSASSHFFQYLTGWVSVDYIDLLKEDVIATGRQSIEWEDEEMEKLYEFLTAVVAEVNKQWRDFRKKSKRKNLKKATQVDVDDWISKLPDDVSPDIKLIVENLDEEDALEAYVLIIESLHNVIPEYPRLHWRHLHPKLKNRVRDDYENKKYLDAADQGVKIYCEEIRSITDLSEDGMELIGKAFGGEKPLIVVADTKTKIGENIQSGHVALSRGLIAGFRNLVAHNPRDSVVPDILSELDCLNILSLISYLLTRLDNAKNEIKVN